MDLFLLSPFFAEYLPFSFLISEAIHHIFPSPLSFLLIQEIRPQLRRIACLLASSYGSGMQYIHLNAEEHSFASCERAEIEFRCRKTISLEANHGDVVRSRDGRQSLVDQGVKQVFGYPEAQSSISMMRYIPLAVSIMCWFVTSRRRCIWRMAWRGRPGRSAWCW